MSVTNIIEVTFGSSTLVFTSPYYKYNSGMYLQFTDLDLPESYQVHFANSTSETSLESIGTSDGVLIPDDVWQTGKTIYCWLYLHPTDDSSVTKYEVRIPVSGRADLPDGTEPSEQEQTVIDQAIVAANAAIEKSEAAANRAEAAADQFGAVQRVYPLEASNILVNSVIDAIGSPEYVDDVDEYAAYGITEKGWYIFARIYANDGGFVSVEGVAGYIAEAGGDHVDVAVLFGVASVSQVVVIDWGTYQETFAFKATDLAVRNLDYRVTFYVYDADEFATWEYALTEDTTFVEGKNYYTKSGESYTLAEVTAGEAVPADTYYVHSKVIISGLVRNVTYRLNEIVDCPMEFILPVIEDETHGAWFEIRCRHAGAYSMTLVPQDEAVIATEHTQKETAGVNMINLHYTVVDGVKIWRFMNTHSSIPA